MKQLVKGSIVLYQNGHYRVGALFNTTCNLKSIFGDTIYFKGVPLEEVKEDYENWNERWIHSETYASM